MSKIGVWIEKSGVKEAALVSSEMAAALSGIAAELAANAGDGYTYDIREGKNRLVARVYPYTDEAIKDNEKNNTLLTVL